MDDDFCAATLRYPIRPCYIYVLYLLYGLHKTLYTPEKTEMTPLV